MSPNSRWLGRASVAALVVAASPTIAAAQVDVMIGPFLGYERLVLNDPVTFGGELTVFLGNIGFRGSGGVPWRQFRGGDNYDDPFYDIEGNERRSFSADGDLLLRLNGGNSRSPFIYGLLGLGVAGREMSLGFDERAIQTHGNWSYGGGVALPIGPLSLTGEVRVRRPTDRDNAEWYDQQSRREYRLGVSLHFGGGGNTRSYSSSNSRRSSTSRVSTSSGTVIAPRTSSSAARARVIPTAERYLGVKYRYGGETPSGFDCSGFVQYVFAKHGVKLPRTSRQQAQAGTRLATRWKGLTPGDLVMFAEHGERISHVAIYAGDNRIIHATSSGGEVRYDDLDSHRGRWFAEHLVAARRVTPDARGLMLDLAKGFGAAVELDFGDRAPRPVSTSW